MFLSVLQSLYRGIQPNPDGSESDPGCSSNVDHCELAAEYVEEFAMNNSAWHETFGPAFQILIENGYGPNERLVEAVVEAVSPTMATSTSPLPTLQRSQCHQCTAVYHCSCCYKHFSSLLAIVVLTMMTHTKHCLQDIS